MSGEAFNWEDDIEEAIKKLYKKRYGMNEEVTNSAEKQSLTNEGLSLYGKLKAKEKEIQGKAVGIARALEPQALKDHRDITKSTTGLRYNEGKLPWHLVDFRALKSMVEVLKYGKAKYDEDQWKKGLSLKEIRDSFIRHMIEWNAGNEVDEESGLSHIGHMMCNLLFYEYFTMVDTSKTRD